MKLYPVDISIDSCMDADDLGKQLVDCFSNIDLDCNVVNIVKIHIGEDISLHSLETYLKKTIVDNLSSMGAKNCIFVPIQKGQIENITVDHVKVLI